MHRHNRHGFPQNAPLSVFHNRNIFMSNQMPEPIMNSKNNSVTTINRKKYVFYRKLGNGAFGQVYAARNIAESKFSNVQIYKSRLNSICLDRSCAVKVIRLDPKNRMASRNLMSSIIKEIQMSKRLARISPNVVYMFDFDFDPKTGRAFIVMELGQNDLEKTLSSRPPLAPTEVKNLWRQLANIALNLHNFGIVSFH